MARQGPERTAFAYAAQAAEVEAARRRLNDLFETKSPQVSEGEPDAASARTDFHAALGRAYPPGFRDDIERLRAREADALKTAIKFLEADPWFFRSGYMKADLIRLINRLPLNARQAGRLRSVVLRAVEGRDRREFRSYCRLARRVDGPDLRKSLAERLQHPDPGIRRRAQWVLEALQSSVAGEGAGS